MTETDVTLLEMEGVGRTYPGQPPVHAVYDATFKVQAGEYVAIMGPSGSGKTTLLTLLGCLDRPTTGSYRLAGHSVSHLSDNQRAALRGRHIGFVYQSFHLMADRSVLDNVLIALLYNRTPHGERLERAQSAVERVGLAHRATFTPRQLSGGEQQRAAIARALVTDPAILLCDEPTGNLDMATSDSILDLFDELNRTGQTIVVVTHDPDVSRRCSRTMRIVDGTLREDGQ